MQTTARVFDVLLLEGSKMLHRVALAVFKLAEPHLLRCRDTVACANALRVMLDLWMGPYPWVPEG